MTVPAFAIDELHDLYLKEKRISVMVMRLDKIQGIPGNKFFKLKYNIPAFFQGGRPWLVTVGGAWSNHLAATAAAGRIYGFQTLGLVRGDELNAASNGILQKAAADGMRLAFLPRNLYKQRHLEKFPTEVHKIMPQLPHPGTWWFLPEGGSNELAVRGCREILDFAGSSFDTVVCASGTGGTLAGITSTLAAGKNAIGIDVSGDPHLHDSILQWNGGKKNFALVKSLPEGRYAKSSPLLEDYCNRFFDKHRIPIEPVYTGRLFLTLENLIKAERFAAGSKILAIHSGGVYASAAMSE